MLRHGSLFSGIGGFDIAATWMGWENVFSCERNPFCQPILNYYWPQTKHYGDIFQFKAAQFRGAVDIITGGFPCQPFSNAGRRKGKTDDRYLFPQACRIISEARPRWIVLENVSGLFSILEPDSLSEMEIKAVELFCKDDNQPVNSTIIRLQQRVIASIVTEIRSAGYVLPALEDGTPVVMCVPAAALDAPHQRDRIWFVAHADSNRDEQQSSDSLRVHRGKGTGGSQERKGQRGTGIPDGLFGIPLPSETEGGEVKASDGFATLHFGAALRTATEGSGPVIPGWELWPAQSPFCGGDDGLPRELDGITFPSWRAESVKAYGNAIVPQVALEIFRSIQATETMLSIRS